MSTEVKDPAIKLFGKTICLLPDDTLPCSIAADQPQPAKRTRSDITTTSPHNYKNTSAGEVSESKEEDECRNVSSEEECGGGAETSSRMSDEEKAAQNPEKETQLSATGGKDEKKEDHESETSDSQDRKNLKKPDKILPCPRCNSRDTKFCYYNNYNVNQPRHFCKNCQRYWTAGGSMRNVPVGSGRRKNKASASNFRHIMVSDALHAVTSLKPNGTVLTFGSDIAVNESVMNLVEKSQNFVSNKRIPASWNAAQWRSPVQAPPSPLSPPGTPVALYGVLAPWSARWISAPASPDQSTPTSPAPPGKHWRDGHILKLSSLSNTGGGGEEECLGKKDVKMEDPKEAAKSSIWSTLGHSPGGSLFKAFNSKDRERDRNHSLVLQANPAALSRSLNFQERT